MAAVNANRPPATVPVARRVQAPRRTRCSSTTVRPSAFGAVPRTRAGVPIVSVPSATRSVGMVLRWASACAAGSVAAHVVVAMSSAPADMPRRTVFGLKTRSPWIPGPTDRAYEVS